MVIRAKAPLRIWFAGGGTDVPPFPAQEGGLVLSATIDRYAYGTLRPGTIRTSRSSRSTSGCREEFAVDDDFGFDGRLDLVKAAVRALRRTQRAGFDLFLHSNAPPGSGLGSSSAMMVVLIGLLKEHQRLPLTDYEVAELASQHRARGPRHPGGRRTSTRRPSAASTSSSSTADAIVVNPLRIRERRGPRARAQHAARATPGRRGRPTTSSRTRRRGSRAATRTRCAACGAEGARGRDEERAAARRLDEFGDLLGDRVAGKKRMSERISNRVIDEAYAEAARPVRSAARSPAPAAAATCCSTATSGTGTEWRRGMIEAGRPRRGVRLRDGGAEDLAGA